MEQTIKKSKRTFNGFDGHIKWGTRFAYAGGDVACNIVFGMVGTLLTLYYTTCAGIDIGTVGIVMLVSRVFDGFSDVIMGILVDKTKSRFGKARPWLLWMSLPFAASAVLLFCVPQVRQDLYWVKILYMFVTYNFCSTVCYTAINLPYGTLSTLMTDKSHERDMLGNVRMGLSPIGKIVAVSLTLPLVKVFGGQGDQSAWIKTMLIWASLALILLLINFFACPEKVNPAMNPQKKALETKLPMKKALKFLVTNKYFWFVLVLWMFQSTSFGVIGTILPYYCQNLVEHTDQGSLYNFLFLVETGTLVVFVFICMPLVKKVGKRNLALFGTFIALAGQIVFTCIPPAANNYVPMLYMSAITRSIGLAPLNAVVFGMLGDVVDFGHWKNGYRQEAFICAGGSVGTKLGSGLASVIITQILEGAGFKSTTEGYIEQSASAQNAIWWIYAIAPIIVAGGVMVILLFYKLDKNYDKMMVELKAREAKLTKEAMHTSIIRLHELEKLEEQENVLLTNKTDLEKKLADINEQLKNINKEKDKVNKREKRR